MTSSIPSCMKDITIVHVGKRNFRVTAASLPAGLSSHKDIYVRPYNKENDVESDNKEITIKLDNVPPSLYGVVIGKGGCNVKQIRSETGTKIMFPSMDLVRGHDVKQRRSETGTKIMFPTIVGTKDGVEMAKKRIEEIIKKESNMNEKRKDVDPVRESVKDSKEEYIIKFSVPSHLCGAIIGKGGCIVEKIKSETKTNISVEDPVVIRGTEDGVEMAKKRIKEIIESTESANYSHNNGKLGVSNTNDSEEYIIKFSIPFHLRGAIIGRGGHIVNQIKSETKTNITVGDPVVIIGTKKADVKMAKKRIEEIIANNPHYNTRNEKLVVDNTNIGYEKKEDIESNKESVKNSEGFEIKFNVPSHLHGAIIGKKGYIVNQIKAETKTNIFVGDPIVISGTKDSVEMAKKRIEEIIANNSHYARNEKLVVDNTKIGYEKKEDIESIRESYKESVKNSKEGFEIKLNVPSHLLGAIIGRGGRTVYQIKSETKTNIIVGDPVVISGTKDSVEMAKKRIEDIIKPLILNSPPTHFISLPLTDDQLQRKVETFKSDVLNLSIKEVDESILINPPSLHITIGMLNLYRKEDIEGAVKLLKSLSTEINNIIGTRTLVSILTGLAVMENDPVKAHVLYTKVEELDGQNTLIKLAEYLTEKFAEAGYLKKDSRPLKLHVTLINTRHRDNDSTPSNNHSREKLSYRIPFNAVPILNKFSNIEFGPNRIESIHISKIGEHDEHGRHRSEGCIKLP